MGSQTVTSGLSKRVGDVAERDFVVLPDQMLVGEAVKVMRKRDVSSILVSTRIRSVSSSSSSNISSSNDRIDEGIKQSQMPRQLLLSPKEQVIGILTERDILYRVMAENKGPYKVTLGDIMSSPVVTISKNAPVRDAVALMQSRQIRRLPVADDSGRVTGLVTLKTVIGNMPSHNIDLPEIDPTRAVAETESVCPYCRAVINKEDTMAAHMEELHVHEGRGGGKVSDST